MIYSPYILETRGSRDFYIIALNHANLTVTGSGPHRLWSYDSKIVADITYSVQMYEFMKRPNRCEE
jgi:hypothetical protein